MVSLLSNPLANVDQLASPPSRIDGLPADLEISLKWAANTLIQSAGILLHLPQTTIATASILFQRFCLNASLRSFALLDAIHAVLFLSSKLTEHAAKPRDIINVTHYLLATSTPSPISPPTVAKTREAYYVPDHIYYTHRARLLSTETSILKALGFQTHVSLPYALAVNYLQSLEALSKDVLKRAFGYLNDGLLSPSMVYITHQPHCIATAAIYLAARECRVRLPEGWWDVFDVEREELGFLVAALKGVPDFVEGQVKVWRARNIPWDVESVENELDKRRFLEDEMEE